MWFQKGENGSKKLKMTRWKWNCDNESEKVEKGENVQVKKESKSEKVKAKVKFWMLGMHKRCTVCIYGDWIIAPTHLKIQDLTQWW